MNNIQIKDKEFTLSIPESDILAAVKRVGEEITKIWWALIRFLSALLNGAFMLQAI